MDAFVCGEVETWCHAQGLGPLVGIDEAGRGPLAGPVVVAAVALPWPCKLAGVDDSKQLTEEERDALFEPICAMALGVGLCVVEPDVIDDLNILRASLYGMSIAWKQLVADVPALRSALVLIDGKDRAPLPANVAQRPIVKGDARSLNIAAASILAKVSRDRIMTHVAHAEWPMYGFDKHKGYATPEHRAAVLEHGLSPIHRQSFTMPGHTAVRDYATLDSMRPSRSRGA
ncbi:MAG: ribonuclease HII [Myxococcota bacterium]